MVLEYFFCALLLCLAPLREIVLIDVSRKVAKIKKTRNGFGGFFYALLLCLAPLREIVLIDVSRKIAKIKKPQSYLAGNIHLRLFSLPGAIA